jgi:8-oxo-dGTP diphosphatase
MEELLFLLHLTFRSSNRPIKLSKTNPGRLKLPGGKIDPSESFDDALKRVVAEETGFQVIIHNAARTAMQEIKEYRIVYLE